MTEISHIEIRNKIYNLLLSNPGLNLSRIAQVLNSSVQLVDYHLSYLERVELIICAKEGGYKRYYIKGEIGTREKKILSLMNQEVPLRIIMFLLEKPFSKPKDIRNELKISAALLTYYLKKLLKNSIITQHPSGEKYRFIIVDENYIIQLLIRYRRNILLERFKQTWLDDIPLSSKTSKKKKEEKNQ